MRNNIAILMLPRSTRPTQGAQSLRDAIVGIRLNGPLATRSLRGASLSHIHAAHPKPAISPA
ncbi:hypothetical protein [Pectobacterium betavasculorum]|uniref:hypothetical protein n=1 Tax=Pectobacterium betavasculorum TaxID=55207 RepID=UPI0012E09891|nr:hypothetical protein [Pectobacterium betavasculorum]